MKIIYVLSGWMPVAELKERPSHNSYYATSMNEEMVFLNVVRRKNTWMDQIRMNLSCLFKVARTSHDILYVPSNVEVASILIFLRSLRIYRKPVVRWKYTPCRLSGNPWKDFLIRFYYRGFDNVFFLTERHGLDSIQNGALKEAQVSIIEYGVDLRWYDRFKKTDVGKELFFISTGRENRDFKTLIEATKQLKCNLSIYTTRKHGDSEYYSYLEGIRREEKRIKIIFSDEWNETPSVVLQKINEQLAKSYAVLICCKAVNYGVGFTNLLESLPLGKPIVITGNPDMPIDVEQEKIGLKVKPGDVAGWVNAINYLIEHPSEAKAMGANARMLAEKKYNGARIQSQILHKMEKLIR